MEVIKYTLGDKIPSTEPIAAALGFFDGVHIAHRALIELLIKEAKERNLTPCVFTFTENLTKQGKKQSLIYNTKDKIDILASLGIEKIILADFPSLSWLSPESFVFDVLIDTLSVRLAASGYNFRFGKGAVGNAELLSELMTARGAEGLILGEQKDNGEAVSATRIRQLLSEGKPERAAELLGMPYFIHGEVERGLGVGGAWGFPTVNTALSGSTPLKTGVYRTAVKIGERLYTGVTNIGSCPTVKERSIHAETLIADYSGDLYGQDVYIYFLGYLREEIRFESIEILKKQIYADRDRAVKENGDLKWLVIGQS